MVGDNNGDKNDDDKMVVLKALYNIGSTSGQHTLATLDRHGRFLLIQVMRVTQFEVRFKTVRTVTRRMMKTEDGNE